MTQELTTTAQNQPVTIPQEKLSLVRNMFASGCTDNEFAVFLELANKYQLDPFARQIWAVKYGNKPAQIFAGRDGFLNIAHRSGKFDGFGEPEFIYDSKGEVTAVKATVYRKDISHPFIQYAWMKEDNLKQGVWLTRPNTMLLKVAETRALRHAFSISGLYSEDEFKDSQPQEPKEYIDVEATPAPEPAAPAEPQPTPKHVYTEEQVQAAINTMKDSGMDTAGLMEKAKLPDGLYNGDIINEAWNCQRAGKV